MSFFVTIARKTRIVESFVYGGINRSCPYISN